MKVRFWGVRGSFPVPGQETNRYGGNTSCVEVRPRRAEPIIIDAGTGLRRLGKQLMQGAFGDGSGTAHLLISHTHWDHIQGLPFFSPLYKRGNTLHLFARQRDDTHLRAVFESQTEEPYFPVPMASLKADIRFHELIEGQSFDIGKARISCTRLNHPWIAIAYRIDADGASVVYASDTAPFRDILLEHEFIAKPPVVGGPLSPADASKLASMREALVGLCQGADVLIYDTQFTQAEYRSRPHWGHSTPDDALEIAFAAKVKTLVLYHHAPERTDDEQDAILRECRVKLAGAPFDVMAAYEGLELSIGEDD
ncbi:MBL fold metallo-hydrolase [Haliangium ochraceum]|uniref:Beta-lactamase domain protein n=1 Tax=Haliangium ochraceum (strain DSM 14365 / JCM 11303 / SMP-2) TaxID=502025 RepID=D0LL06_HALO1|nr:MBL fold metallo-hydrolase [Haliangium ochraceum]ACY16726.1 beta-lactamase domain protein [Haliangium ochraceum DSM 14365]